MPVLMKHKAIYPGTFDPITNGHIDIISRAALIFPELVVAVADSNKKQPYFSLKERVAFVDDAVGILPGVSVVGFDNLLVNFVREQEASIIIRGLRGISDFDHEFQLAGMNKKLVGTLETLFLTTSEHVMCISSTMVREIARLGGDVSDFVPDGVNQALKSIDFLSR